MTYWSNDPVQGAYDGWSSPVRVDERHPQTPGAPRAELDPDDYHLVHARASAAGNQQLLATLEHALNRTSATHNEREFCRNQVRIAAASIRAESAAEVAGFCAPPVEAEPDLLHEFPDDSHGDPDVCATDFVDELAAIAWSAMRADETKNEFLARLRALLGVA